ncbi:hypothetical protein D4S03_06425 [bacterium]|nr:MAG: hypothetical protein D4S03_06425 [bacterium]
MAIYRIDFKNGNESDVKNSPTTSKIEIKATEAVFLFPKLKLWVSKNEVINIIKKERDAE